MDVTTYADGRETSVEFRSEMDAGEGVGSDTSWTVDVEAWKGWQLETTYDGRRVLVIDTDAARGIATVISLEELRRIVGEEK